MWLRISLLVIAFIVTSIAPPAIKLASGEKPNPYLKTAEQDSIPGSGKSGKLQTMELKRGDNKQEQVQMPPGGALPPQGDPPPPSKGPTKGPKN